MTSRIGSPDTDADVALRTSLDQKPVRSFVMVAGAGSGKTTSLIKALEHLSRTKGESMRRRGQQIACITYTDVAVREISGDVDNAALFHVSTIHSFLWQVIHTFQSDLKVWVAARIAEKITVAEEKLAKPRTQAKTRVKLNEEIARHHDQLTRLADVPKFTYGTGSNYSKGLLGHDDVLKAGPAMIAGHALLRSLVAKRFPYIFVDESQDTNPDVVAALKQIAATPGIGLCLGFFGDPMQKIYMAGVGAIETDEHWDVITKPENFRCPLSILSVINRIRAEDDGLEQTPGRRVGPDGNEVAIQGSARMFIAQAGEDRGVRLTQVREFLAVQNADPAWLSDDLSDDVRMLILVHRIAASRLGFANLYSSLNDKAPSSLKDGLQEGTSWVLRPFVAHLLPLVRSARAGNDFEVIAALRRACPLLAADQVAGKNVGQLLTRIKQDVDALSAMFEDGSGAAVKDVLAFVRDRQLIELDERLIPYLTDAAAAEEEGDEDSEFASVVAYLGVPVVQFWGYLRYIENLSPFATQQGIKGAQFERVLVVLDDEESRYNSFSYGRYFGIDPLSKDDLENIEAGKESVLDRTRRLFYVCCSRARKDLAVVLFVPNPQAAQQAVLAKGFFPPQDIHVL